MFQVNANACFVYIFFRFTLYNVVLYNRYLARLTFIGSVANSGTGSCNRFELTVRL